MRKKLIVLASALVLLVTSCKKEDEKDSNAVNVQNVAGTYKLSKYAVKVTGSSAETDITDDYYSACELDDLYYFKTDMTFQSKDAGSTCGFGDYESDWALPNSSTMVVDGETFTIVKFDGKNLVLSSSDEYNGISGSFITYLVKQ